MSNSNADVAKYFAREQPKLRALIRSMVFNPADADDLLQDVAVVAMENAQRYEPTMSLEAWIVGIAKKRVLKFFEVQQRRKKFCFSSEIVESLSAAVVEDTDKANSLDLLQACLDKLDDQKRSLVLRRHSPGVTARELANEIGYTDTRMSRLLNGLYAALMKCVDQQLAGGEALTSG